MQMIESEKASCYLIAKKYGERGCIAVKTEYGKALASLVTYLGIRTLSKKIEILTVSSKEMYGEYAPYTVLDSEKEFINQVLEM